MDKVHVYYNTIYKAENRKHTFSGVLINKMQHYYRLQNHDFIFTI